MGRLTINSSRDRAFTRMLADFPGTISFDAGVTDLDCAIRIGTDERESAEGGFVRVRSATVWIARTELATVPDLEERSEVTITQDGNAAEVFRVFEVHAQSENHWLLRCGQWQ